MLYEVDEQFVTLYDSVRETLFQNYTQVAKNSNIENLTNDLNAIAYESYRKAKSVGDADTDAEITDYLERIAEIKDDADFKVFEFISLAALSSYYSLSYLHDLTGVVEHDDLDKFGYKGSLNNLKHLCKLTSMNADEFEEGALQRLMASQRECTCSQYFSDKKYLIDVKRVKKLLEKYKVTINVDEDLQEAIVNEFGKVLDSEIESILEVYKNILEASFGLNRYVGVFTLNDTNPVAGITKGAVYKSSIQPVGDFRQYANELKKSISVILPYSTGYSDRQFNMEAIYNNAKKSPNKATYFPHKVLEIISLCSWSTNESHHYRACTNGESTNLAKYIKYLRECFEADIFNYTAYVCKRDYRALPQDIKSEYSVHQILNDFDCPARQSFLTEVVAKIKYYTKCVTTIILLASLKTGNSKKFGRDVLDVLSFRIKVAYNGTLVNNQTLCSELSKSLYKNSDIMSGAETTPYTVTALGTNITDYAYTFNAEKVYARPIFAYKALEALAEQQMKLNWQNILLGQYADESLCRSAAGEKVNLQSVQLHNIYAGSRSGKGVMCFNIFATAIASQIPIFYVDRKPDTAVIMKKLGPGMFAVNGGQYSAEIDLEKQFVPADINYKIPSYLESAFEDLDLRRDYMYFRAMMLLFSLVVFMDKVQNKSDPRYVKIAQLLANGAVFVFDEFTNFTNKFLSTKPTTQGWFKECYSISGINEWKKLLSSVNSANLDYESKKSAEKQNESQIAKAEGKLESAKDDAKNFSLDQLYFAELADDYNDLVSTIPELFRAGGAFVKQMQIFIIGQNIPSEYYDGDIFFTNSNGKSTKKFNSSTHKAGESTKPNVPMIKMLNNMAGDYILGYQPPTIGDPKYLAQDEKNRGKLISADMLTASRRCFCYHKPGVALSYNEALKMTDTNKAFNGNMSAMSSYLNDNFTYFKPFLILNNGIQPPDELLEADGEDGYQVSNELANKRQGAKGFEQYAASQYVGQCLTSCNKAGLKWSDLLGDNPSPNNPNVINDAIGFEGYIKAMSSLNGNGGVIPVDDLNKSGKVMDVLVNEVFGYKDGNWLDFLADFRPEGLFKPKDFLDAIDRADTYSIKTRLIGSFFSDALTKETGGMSFAVVFADELGTLASYYSGQGSSEDDTVGDDDDDLGVEHTFVDDDDDDDDKADNYDDDDDDRADSYADYEADSYDDGDDYEADSYDDEDEDDDNHHAGEKTAQTINDAMAGALNEFAKNDRISEIIANVEIVLATRESWRELWDDNNINTNVFATELVDTKYPPNGIRVSHGDIEKEVYTKLYKLIYGMVATSTHTLCDGNDTYTNLVISKCGSLDKFIEVVTTAVLA